MPPIPCEISWRWPGKDSRSPSGALMWGGWSTRMPDVQQKAFTRLLEKQQQQQQQQLPQKCSCEAVR
ncbi:hypothetical protein L345_03155, partial [Ophiophagus hannah]